MRVVLVAILLVACADRMATAPSRCSERRVISVARVSARNAPPTARPASQRFWVRWPGRAAADVAALKEALFASRGHLASRAHPVAVRGHVGLRGEAARWRVVERGEVGAFADHIAHVVEEAELPRGGAIELSVHVDLDPGAPPPTFSEAGPPKSRVSARMMSCFMVSG